MVYQTLLWQFWTPCLKKDAKMCSEFGDTDVEPCLSCIIKGWCMAAIFVFWYFQSLWATRVCAFTTRLLNKIETWNQDQYNAPILYFPEMYDMMPCLLMPLCYCHIYVSKSKKMHNTGIELHKTGNVAMATTRKHNEWIGLDESFQMVLFLSLCDHGRVRYGQKTIKKRNLRHQLALTMSNLFVGHTPSSANFRPSTTNLRKSTH